MFKSKKVSQLIIRTLLLATLVSTLACSTAPGDGASSSSGPAASSSSGSATSSRASVPVPTNLVKADGWVQELGHWAQDQMEIPREEQCDIFIDKNLLPSDAQGARVENGIIILDSIVLQSRGTLVHCLLHEAKHKASRDNEHRNSAWYPYWASSLPAGVTCYTLAILSFLTEKAVTCTTKVLLIPSIILVVNAIYEVETNKLSFDQERAADTAALAAMHCSYCVREAGKTSSCVEFAAEGYLLEDAFIAHAEELEVHHEPLCAYHHRQQTISAILEKFKTPIFIPKRT